MNANHEAWKARFARQCVDIDKLEREIDALGRKLDRSTSGGVESRHAGSAASLNWGVGAAQVKTASADTTADLSGESGMPSVQLRPAGMRPEVRPHADNQGTAGVAPGPLTLNAAASAPTSAEVTPIPSAAAPDQPTKADGAPLTDGPVHTGPEGVGVDRAAASSGPNGR